MDYFKIIELNGKRLAVYKTGEIVFWNNSKYNGNYKKGWIKRECVIDNGYLFYMINKKRYSHHRIIAYTFLNLNIEDSSQFIDHINNIRNDNRLENLRIVNSHTNMWNRSCKGYTYRKKINKYESSICFNKKKIYLGRFDTEEEARKAYLQAKEIYHKI